MEGCAISSGYVCWEEGVVEFEVECWGDSMDAFLVFGERGGSQWGAADIAVDLALLVCSVRVSLTCHSPSVCVWCHHDLGSFGEEGE